jgi:hypothetical protein
MSLIFLEKVKENQRAFAKKVEQIGKELDFNPNWLMALMNSESAGTFSPSILNFAGSGAVGLIQFMPKTAIYLGTTVEQLAKMTNLEQLDWVKKYIVVTMRDRKIMKVEDYDDLYFMIFYPAAIGKPDTWVFPDQIYAQNKGIDMNRNGQITVAEFREFIKRKIPLHLFLTFMNNDTKKKPNSLLS